MIKTIEIAPYIYAGELAEYLESRISYTPSTSELRQLILEFFLQNDLSN
jgi:hypothetical protein